MVSALAMKPDLLFEYWPAQGLLWKNKISYACEREK